jgi:hypothetical protein
LFLLEVVEEEVVNQLLMVLQVVQEAEVHIRVLTILQELQAKEIKAAEGMMLGFHQLLEAVEVAPVQPEQTLEHLVLVPEVME